MKVAAFYENIKEGAEASGLSTADALARLKTAGLDNIYANYTSLRDDRPEIDTTMKELGIGVEGLYGFFDFAHKPEDMTDAVECIDLAAACGAKNVLLLPGIYFPDDADRKEEIQVNMSRGLAKAVIYGRAKGVDVTLEDFDGIPAPYNCIGGMVWVMEHTEGLLCSFDTGNFCMYHEDPLEAFHALKPYISTVHCKDRSDTPCNPGDHAKECADGSPIYPCTTGKGYIPFETMIKELRADGYDGGLIAELFDVEPDVLLDEIADSVKYLKSLAEKY